MILSLIHIFTAMGCAAGGILLGLLVKKQRVTASRGEKISLDRFFLKKGTYAFIGLVLMAFVYGLLVNYLSVFARERHVMANPGYFFPVSYTHLCSRGWARCPPASAGGCNGSPS